MYLECKIAKAVIHLQKSNLISRADLGPLFISFGLSFYAPVVLMHQSASVQVEKCICSVIFDKYMFQTAFKYRSSNKPRKGNGKWLQQACFLCTFEKTQGQNNSMFWPLAKKSRIFSKKIQSYEAQSKTWWYRILALKL